jgi:hypothetical protein
MAEYNILKLYDSTSGRIQQKKMYYSDSGRIQ